jgi:hypothetical protein
LSFAISELKGHRSKAAEKPAIAELSVVFEGSRRLQILVLIVNCSSQFFNQTCLCNLAFYPATSPRLSFTRLLRGRGNVAIRWQASTATDRFFSVSRFSRSFPRLLRGLIVLNCRQERPNHGNQ